ncbi:MULTISPECIES: response regulator transcription factor [Carnobacterium]|uniref:DNA-binding response regulator n=1 Tax=Carnobacterium divergens TaxID=2748 RepID=A0A7Z8CZP6_CARDV|nr:MULTISPECIES: response regulator transcription factor [Carnobacterium]MDT1940243.1 response regulator transcription factor [Carnobacterium divergens]MDT1942681.1 response regulator transcription factor [Carnobacterium divergens]MDT1948487.1 response regulator transcription factor [Carnobacterium divergens]MDT1950968.1 response regulator transcription factor [Carnobacterium divergens]MDT1955798.1 response regulator transcription factor [Carnobacterium divergens]
MNILIADDSPEIVHIVRAYLKKDGFTVFTASNGEEALDIFYQEKIDLAIVDWMMPKLDGIEVTKTIKAESPVKVLMLTAKNTGADEFLSLTNGADDYITKPFHPQVLMLRIKKLLGLAQTIFIQDLMIDPTNMKVWKKDDTIDLTKKEFELLMMLFKNRGTILTREQLLIGVWGMEYDGVERTVDTHIRRLREKVGTSIVHTKRGVGYTIENEL